MINRSLFWQRHREDAIQFPNNASVYHFVCIILLIVSDQGQNIEHMEHMKTFHTAVDQVIETATGIVKTKTPLRPIYIDRKLMCAFGVGLLGNCTFSVRKNSLTLAN